MTECPPDLGHLTARPVVAESPLAERDSLQHFRNLVDVDALSSRDIDRIFQRASALRAASTPLGNMSVQTLRGHIVGMLFFEPSTRTRLSFELAAQRLGAVSIPLEVSRSSIEKAETLYDTLQTLVALGVTIAVIRHTDNQVYEGLCGRLDLSILNAGHGVIAHPTQALLDAFTLQQRMGTLDKKVIVLCGDIRHSRVARSNIKLLHRLGAELVLTGPPQLLPSKSELPVQNNIRIASLDEVIPFADAIMCLRVQHERHQREGTDRAMSAQEYLLDYGLTAQRFAKARPECVLLHPGPVNRGTEVEASLVEHARSLIVEQVRNGLYIRMAALEWLTKVIL